MMFDDNIEDLMNKDVTKEDLKKGLYFRTSLKGFYVVIDQMDFAPLITVYETATFPSDGYDVPSVKRVVDVCFPQDFENPTLRDYCMDMLADGKTKYLPTYEMEDWEIEQLKNAISV